MQSLSDLIKNTYHPIKTGSSTRVSEPSLEKWEQAKTAVNKLPPDYNRVMMLRYKAHPETVSKRPVNGGTVIEGTSTIEGFECTLYVLEDANKQAIKAEYQLWNHRTSTVYIRDLGAIHL